jgi:hypothetical protein
MGTSVPVASPRGWPSSYQPALLKTSTDSLLILYDHNSEKLSHGACSLFAYPILASHALA